jgi:hypothetical protein
VILADAVAQTVISNSALTHSWLGLSRRTPKHLRKGIGNSYFGKPVLTGNVSIRRGRFKGGVWKRDARFFLTALDLYAELFRDFGDWQAEKLPWIRLKQSRRSLIGCAALALSLRFCSRLILYANGPRNF